MVAIVFPALSHAQQKVKFGHLNMEDVYKLMPGTDTLDANFQAYFKDLQDEGEALQKEVEKVYMEYQQKQATYSPAVRKMKEEEIQKMMMELQNFEQEAQIKLSQKKEELLMPFQEKILDAAKAVAKEEGYTYIFNASALSYAADSEDIANKVKTKLGIK